MIDIKKKSPYKGLEPFSYKDSRNFFGRDDSITDVLELIASNSFTAVVGFSGSGKSSLVYAGVLRQLHRGYIDGANDGWQIVAFTPGDSPLENLYKGLLQTDWLQHYMNENSLKPKEIKKGFEDIKTFLFNHPIPNNERLLIVVDQFEEIFSNEENLVGNYNSSSKFIKFLKEITPKPIDRYEVPSFRINVVITLRADYLSKLIYFEDLPKLLSNNIHFISTIDDTGLKDAILEPSIRQNKRFTPELINLLVGKSNKIRNLKRIRDFRPEESEEDDTLPLLQHFLMHLWNTFSEEDVFTIDHYLKLGPLQKVIDKHLNDIYFFELNMKQRRLTKFLFCLLSKRDNDNPKRVVRNPNKLTIKMVISLFQELNLEELHSNYLKKDLIDIIHKFSREDVKVINVKNHKKSTSINENSEIDIMHESVFRNWNLCKDWLSNEVKKESRLEQLIVEKDNIERYWSYEKIKDSLLDEKYFSSSFWLDIKGISTDKKAVEKAFIKLRKIQLQQAISKTKTEDLIGLLKLVNKRELLLSTYDIQNNKEFKEEFFNALMPKDLRFMDRIDTSMKEKTESYWNVQINSRLSKGHKISHYAAFGGNIDVLETLNKSNKEVFFKKKYFTDGANTPFNLAIYNNQLEAAKYIYDVLKVNNKEYLIEKEDNEFYLPVQWAGLFGDVKLFEWLDSIMDISKSSVHGNALNFCVIYDNHEVAEYLISKKLDLNKVEKNGHTPLHLACGYGSLESVKIILRDSKKMSIINEITSSVDNFGLNPLMRAISPWSERKKRKCLQVVAEILKYSKYFDINEKRSDDSYQWTALHYAIYNQDFETIQLLLNTRGINLDVIGKDGFNTIHFASKLKSLPILKSLLNHAKSNLSKRKFLGLINKKTEDNATATMIAYQYQRFDNLYLLMEYGAEFEEPFGENYDFAEQGIEKWNDQTLKKEVAKSFTHKFKWSEKLLFQEGNWVNNSKKDTLKLYDLSSNLKNVKIKSIIASRSHDLSFYPNAKLHELRVNEIKNHNSLFFINHNDNVTLLDGNSPSIHSLNAELPIVITDENVSDYLEFFCAMVHGKHGAFKIIKSVNDICWFGDDEVGMKHTGKFIQFVIKNCTLNFSKAKDSSTWSTKALVNFGNALFLGNFLIHKTGRVELLDDTPVCVNMSVRVPIFNSGILMFNKRSPEKEDEKLEIISFRLAAKAGLLKIMKWCQKNEPGFDINSVDKDGKSALDLAKENNHKRVVNWLLKQKNDNKT